MKLRRDHAVMLAAAGVVFVAIALVTRQAQRDALALAVRDDADRQPLQVIQVQRALKAMQLVTVIVQTKVVSSSADSSWRGDVAASVTVPVDLLYGVDLSRAAITRADAGPLASAYTVRLPAPARIGTQVYTDKELSDITTGWLRLRSRAGEYHLGLARKGLSESAERLVLAPADAEMVRDETARRVVELVRMIVSPDNAADIKVQVIFDDAPARAEASK